MSEEQTVEKKYGKLTTELVESTLAMMTDGVTTMAEIKGISPEDLEGIYKIGHTYYMTGKMEEAESLFYMLCVISHTNPKYWEALGAVRQVRKEYDEAIKAYVAAALYDMNRPKPHYYSAECNLVLGDLDAAESGIVSLLDLCPAGTPENDKFRAKGEALLRVIKDTRAKKGGAA